MLLVVLEEQNDDTAVHTDRDVMPMMMAAAAAAAVAAAAVMLLLLAMTQMETVSAATTVTPVMIGTYDSTSNETMDRLEMCSFSTNDSMKMTFSMLNDALSHAVVVVVVAAVGMDVEIGGSDDDDDDDVPSDVMIGQCNSMVLWLSMMLTKTKPNDFENVSLFSMSKVASARQARALVYR
jgi:hypothetical protein